VARKGTGVLLKLELKEELLASLRSKPRLSYEECLMKGKGLLLKLFPESEVSEEDLRWM